MFKFLTRGVCAVIVSTALLPAESPACCFCHCFDWCSKPAPAPTYAAAPVCAAPACNVCPQQVSYVPQTSFRTEYTCVPVTTCRPITTCDPCGGTQTVMQPVTTFVRRPVMVPVTTMRPVVTQVNFAAPSCPTCGGAADVRRAAYAYSRRHQCKFRGTGCSDPRLRQLRRRGVGELWIGPGDVQLPQFGRASTEFRHAAGNVRPNGNARDGGAGRNGASDDGLAHTGDSQRFHFTRTNLSRTARGTKQFDVVSSHADSR